MVKDSKMFIDPSDFSEPESALDLYSNSIRSSLAFKGALSEPTYVAKVLSPPLPLNPAQAGVFNEPAAVLGLEANEPKTWRQKASEAALSALGAGPRASPALSKFTFYGRIEKIHGGLLREPYPITYAPNPTAAYQLIRQHTQFISAADTTEFPSVGDLVNVRLEPGTAGKWNLQYGTYIGIRDHSSVTPPHLTPSPKDKFDNNTSPPTTMGEATNRTSLGKNQAKYYTPKAEGERTIDTIVIHFTGGHCGSGKAQGTIDRMAEGPTIRYEVNNKLVPCSTPNAAAAEDLICIKRSKYDNIGGSAFEKVVHTSIHYAVDQSGTAVQGVLEKDIANHAVGVNSRSIGIEINGSDDLIKSPSCKPSMFTPTLMNALVQLVSEIAARHNIPIDRAHIKGHDEYYSGVAARRRDPGTFKSRNTAQVGHASGWEWDVFIDALKNKSQLAQASDGTVTSSGLA